LLVQKSILPLFHWRCFEKESKNDKTEGEMEEAAFLE
jgi:hypothetical protein